MTIGRLLQVLWPAFLVGGMIEMFVFAMVDPEDVHLPGGIELSRTAIYSLAFFCFWAFAAIAGALTAWICKTTYRPSDGYVADP